VTCVLCDDMYVTWHTCVSHVCRMCVTCVSHVCHMCVTCVSHVCHMCVTCVSHVCHMCITSRHLSDMSHVSQVGFHDTNAIWKTKVATRKNEIVNRLDKTKKWEVCACMSVCLGVCVRDTTCMCVCEIVCVQFTHGCKRLFPNVYTTTLWGGYD